MKVARIAAAFRQCGLSLIELMVAMAIGLIVTLAVTSVVTLGEAHKRTTTSTNDMGQSGSFAIYQLDRAVRSAGSALVQSANNGVFGCKLNVGSILPRANTDDFPVPFKDNFLKPAGGTVRINDLRVAPLLIGKSMSDDDVSDVLVIMRGNGNAGGVPRRIKDPGSATQLKLESSVGFAVGDILLVSQPGVTDCLMEQVSSLDPVANPGELNLGGTYYTAGSAVTAATLAASTSTYVTSLGNASQGSVQFTLFGVGANNTLFSYDLLQGAASDASQAMADGVKELHAVYGLDTNGDGTLDTWADSGDTGYDIATVMTTPATIRQIVAVRVALVLKSPTHEQKAVMPACDGSTSTVEAECASLRYFTNLANTDGTSLQREVDTKTVAGARHFRTRVVESTIPLRNMQLTPAPL